MIHLVGDIHGKPDILSKKNKNKMDDPIEDDDIIIFLGDFGLFWYDNPSKEEKYWLDWLTKKPNTIMFLDGNHENHNVIEQFPEEERYGGKVGIHKTDYGEIIHLKRGEIYTIENETFLVLGGALSIDKIYRRENKSWWPQELWSKDQEHNALDNLTEKHWDVDYVLSHTCPDSVIFSVIDGFSPKIADPTSKFFEFIANRLEFKGWFFGHFHVDRNFMDPAEDFYACLYQKPLSLMALKNIKKNLSEKI